MSNEQFMYKLRTLSIRLVGELTINIYSSDDVKCIKYCPNNKILTVCWFTTNVVYFKSGIQCNTQYLSLHLILERHEAHG